MKNNLTHDEYNSIKKMIEIGASRKNLEEIYGRSSATISRIAVSNSYVDYKNKMRSENKKHRKSAKPKNAGKKEAKLSLEADNHFMLLNVMMKMSEIVELINTLAVEMTEIKKRQLEQSKKRGLFGR